MSNTYFTAGPSQLHPHYATYHAQALQHDVASIGHRTAAFRKIYQHTYEQLTQLLNLPNGHSVFFASSATEIWERMISNLVHQHSLHFVNGSFSDKFYHFAKSLRKNSHSIIAPHGYGFNYDFIEIGSHVELVCTTQNETSSGVFMPPINFEIIKKSNPNALLCTDLVSIAPISSIDYSLVDSSFFSVQKCFGMSAGLGVWIVNEACIEKAKQLENKKVQMGAHHTLSSFYKHAKNWETPSTPNVVAIYILGKIAEDFNKIGIENIRKQTAEKAKMLYDFASNSSICKPLVKVAEIQSPTVAVLQTSVESNSIIDALKEKNLYISSGYGDYKKQEIRIANFPTTTIEDMEKLINALKSI